MYMEMSLGPKASVKSFDQCVPIGTLVYHHGVAKNTWSHAGLGPKNVPCVWLDDTGPTVPLTELVIPGVEMVGQRRSSGEATGKGHGRKHVECKLYE
jgi:hypothetical protein